MVDAPVFQECACGICHELGSTISCTLIRDAKVGEEPAEGVNNALGPLLSSFNDGPIRVAVHSDKVVPTFVAEEIGGRCTGRGMLVEWSGGVGHLAVKEPMRLHWLQLAVWDLMAVVMPGQNTVVSARAVMDVTPWCAECSASRMCCRSDGGMTVRSLYIITPSTA